MSSLDIAETSEDFWWSQKTQIAKSNIAHTVPVCDVVAENEQHTLIQPVNGGDEMTIKTEETTEHVKSIVNNNSVVGKRPSGAQRRKRKWRRLESHQTSFELNNIETGFKILSINDAGQDKLVVPSLSKNGLLNENINQRNDNEKKFISKKFATHSERHSFNSGKSRDKRFKPVAEYDTAQQYEQLF